MSHTLGIVDLLLQDSLVIFIQPASHPFVGISVRAMEVHPKCFPPGEFRRSR